MQYELTLLLATLIFLIGGVSSTKAMEFRLVHNPEQNIQVIIGEGPIVAGDVGRLETAASGAGRDDYGNIVLYLNSPGGSVDAAFEMVEFMDREEFSALVASDDICASACASIVYVSARFHQVLGTGRLGIHSCYTVGKNQVPEPSAFCNDRIAENAIQHGTSYSAVNMWQKGFGPESMAWMEQDVACKFGLCGPPGFDATPAVPSFDCRTATQVSEKAICGNKRLARHEASLSKFYIEAIKSMPSPEKERFRDEQRAWLKYRDTCQADGVQSCVLERMKSRWNEVMEKWGKYYVR